MTAAAFLPSHLLIISGFFFRILGVLVFLLMTSCGSEKDTQDQQAPPPVVDDGKVSTPPPPEPEVLALSGRLNLTEARVNGVYPCRDSTFELLTETNQVKIPERFIQCVQFITITPFSFKRSGEELFMGSVPVGSITEDSLEIEIPVNYGRVYHIYIKRMVTSDDFHYEEGISGSALLTGRLTKYSKSAPSLSN